MLAHLGNFANFAGDNSLKHPEATMPSPAPNSIGTWIRTFAVGRDPRWTLARILILIVTTVVLFNNVLLLRRIESVSMLPSFREGSIHLINRLSYRFQSTPQRGDIVGIRTSGVTVMYVKRIIGLPGETIAIRNGTVLIDGQPLEESYVRPQRRPWNLKPRRLDSDQYFVIGDNRSMAQEQHEFGAIRAERIIGKVIW